MSASNKLMAKVPRCLYSESQRSGNTFLFRDIRANGSRFWFWNYACSVVKYVCPFRRLKCRCRFPDSKIRKSWSAADRRYKRLQTKGKKSGRSVSLYDVCHESYAARLRAATKTTVSGVTSKKPNGSQSATCRKTSGRPLLMHCATRDRDRCRNEP